MREAALSSNTSCCPHCAERIVLAIHVVMANTNATLPVETAVIWSDDEAEADAPATTTDARPADAAPRGDADAPAAEAKRDADDDDDSWAEFY